MASFSMRRFASPEALGQIRQEHLRELLRPFGDYLGHRGVVLSDDRPIDLGALLRVLMAPHDQTPEALVNALYLVHETSSTAHMEDLLKAVPKGFFADESDLTPADVAAQVWLRDPALLERVHAGRFVGARKVFEYHTSERKPPLFMLPTDAQVSALEAELSRWFVAHKKGDFARVFVYGRPDGIWFVIRHGGTFQRENVLKEGGEPEAIVFRPARYDVVVYDPKSGELRVNASTTAEKELYRSAFGAHVFEDPDHFPSVRFKYTLEPLNKDPEGSLVCSDIAGMDSVRVKEVAYFWGGRLKEVEIRRAKDLGPALERRRNGKVPSVRMIHATFEVKFRDSKRPRCVKIELPNVARYTRDGDGHLIEEWLAKRGFSAANEAV
jgi:hypothetical protein